MAILKTMDRAGRDLGLRRLSHLTRWSVGAAVVLTGVFSALVAHARPGRAKAASVTTTTVPAPGDSFLQPPVQRPGRGNGGGGLVTSGAS